MWASTPHHWFPDRPRHQLKICMIRSFVLIARHARPIEFNSSGLPSRKDAAELRGS